eukprot:Nitzschia sp. Nitz4//scaffold167_size49223//10984//18384//NITZ4_007032-RA/size49223-processed-gene-0.31-mRNA-1//-1//CDS//3329538266//3869//frame0
MGKQSKKKKTKQDKQAHKAKVQERRERIIEGTTQNTTNDEADEHDNGDTKLNKWTILEGDRVWFEDTRSDPNDHNTRRGLVKEVNVDSHGRVSHYSVQPLSDYFENGAESRTVWQIEVDSIHRDVYNWTTRFDVGQKIVCNTSDGWLPGVVTHLFPVWEMERGTHCVPIYKMTTYPSLAGLHGAHDEVASPEDNDHYVRMYPTGFRYAVGDKVLVNSQYIYPCPSNSSSAMKQYYATTELWLPATVSNVDIIGLSDLYAVYECEMRWKGGKKLVFYVEFDTDEHICSESSSPRDRLLDAIKQDCCFEHINGLVDEFNIDVSLIHDLVLSTAIEYGSFATLLLLEEKDKDLRLADIEYPNGNYLFHELAKSPCCLTLLKGMAKISFQRDYFSFSLLRINTSRHCLSFDQTNRHGETWLDLVLKRQDLRLIDCLSSPFDGLLWAFVHNTKEENIRRLSLERKEGSLEWALAMENFIFNRTVLDQLMELTNCYRANEAQLLQKPHMGALVNGGKSQHLLRFVYEWESHTRCSYVRDAVREIMTSTVKHGLFQIFKALVDADEAVLDVSCTVKFGSTRDDFVQYEIHGISEKENKSMFGRLDIPSALVCIQSDLTYPYLSSKSDIDAYINWLLAWASRRSNDANFNFMAALDASLKREESYSSIHRILQYVKAILQDDDGICGRLQMLNYMIVHKGARPPSPLVVIRERNCGALRWLIEGGYVQLMEPALYMNDPNARKLLFLGGQRVSKAITTGTFLCFACVEYDSLFSLSWLVKGSNASIDQVINGFNILHVCAFFGRLEILLWISTTPLWSKLLSMAPSTRPGFMNYSIFEVAISKGHTNVVLMLEAMGYSMSSAPLNYSSILSSALKSPFRHVRIWGQEMTHSSKLASNCEKLLQLLSKRNNTLFLQQHIEDTGCLKIDEWAEAEIYRSDKPLPSGRSFADVLSACFSHSDSDFILNVCHNVARNFEKDHHMCDFYYDKFLRFWGIDTIGVPPAKWHIDRIQEFARYHHDLTMSEWLDHPSLNSVSIFDPNQNPIVKGELLGGELSQRLKQEEVIIWTCAGILRQLTRNVSRCIQSGCTLELEALTKMYRDVARKFLATGRNMCTLNDSLLEYEMDSVEKTQVVNMAAKIYCESQYHDHRSCKHLLFSQSDFSTVPVYLVAAMENYDDLLNWLLQHGYGWTLEMQKEIMQLAGYMGYTEIVDTLLSFADSEELCISCALGAAEAGRKKFFMRMTQRFGTDSLKQIFVPFSPLKEKDVASETTLADGKKQLSTYLSTCVVYGYLSSVQNVVTCDAQIPETYQDLLLFLVEKCDHSSLSLFQATMAVLNKCFDINMWRHFPALLSHIHDRYEMNCFCPESKECIAEINRRLLENSIWCQNETTDEVTHIAKDWLSLLMKWGVNIQQVTLGRVARYDREKTDPLEPFLVDLQREQLENWASFDILKNNGSLEQVQEAVKAGTLLHTATDRAGLHLVHVAAAYNRTDVLSWLIDIGGASLDMMDLENRTVLDIARASNAHMVVAWIEERQARERLSRFFCINVPRKLALNRWLRYVLSVTRLQAMHRGRQVRRVLRSVVLMRLEGSRHFATIWETALLFMSTLESDVTMSSWVSLRSRHENRCFEFDDDDLLELAETGRRLTDATSMALQVGAEGFHNRERNDASRITNSPSGEVSAQPVMGQLSTPMDIHMSNDVVRWLKQSDSKFRHFFVRRMEQLRQGQRSRILAKRLKGSSSTIYETYLEQKSGQRILWQEEGSSIFVWYVAKHKSVSRLMRLIDDCESRSSRQRISVDTLTNNDRAAGEINGVTNHAVRLNPLGNVPMKVYSMQYEDLHQIMDASWTPRLYLSTEERSIVESRGTVLLLGRSGTGKTVCICNRMELDRYRHQYLQIEGMPELKQLFVARSQKLRRFVAESVGETSGSTFSVFSQLVQSLEFALPGTNEQLFAHSSKMDYVRFKNEVYNGSQHVSVSVVVDPLVVWTNIRTFLKGSIEAFSQNQSTHVLDKAQFMALGKKRCRLSPEEREAVYDIFVRYQKVMEAKRLWDDCDRMTSVLKRVQSARQNNHPVMEQVHQDKIYVDEVQDYTQVEILLFFLLSGPGDLFLAGDPAQSVVEGVEFRFEEIRSVGYFVAGQQRDLIPDKPKTVSMNFRSHSGVLDTAAAVLRRMFEVFPDSAKQLGEDRGMFTGPRPGVFHKVPVASLKALVSGKLNGAVILTHDESVPYWKQMLDYELVYGIRAAKGLEFKSVIVLDFFADLPKEVQKPWRDLLLGRECHVPELEGQLKLLYTGVTRCIERLFFAETTRSVSGDAFVRWSTTSTVRPTTLATKQNVDDVEAMAMTQDEWTASGLSNAEMAELHAENHEWTEALSMLDKARFCFEQGKDADYARKVRVYRQSLLFRQGLEEGEDLRELATTNMTELEVRGAQWMERLLEENLVMESRYLIESICPHVDSYTREQLEKNFLASNCLVAVET